MNVIIPVFQCSQLFAIMQKKQSTNQWQELIVTSEYHMIVYADRDTAIGLHKHTNEIQLIYINPINYDTEIEVVDTSKIHDMIIDKKLGKIADIFDQIRGKTILAYSDNHIIYAFELSARFKYTDLMFVYNVKTKESDVINLDLFGIYVCNIRNIIVADGFFVFVTKSVKITNKNKILHRLNLNSDEIIVSYDKFYQRLLYTTRYDPHIYYCKLNGSASGKIYDNYKKQHKMENVRICIQSNGRYLVVSYNDFSYLYDMYQYHKFELLDIFLSKQGTINLFPKKIVCQTIAGYCVEYDIITGKRTEIVYMPKELTIPNRITKQFNELRIFNTSSNGTQLIINVFVSNPFKNLEDFMSFFKPQNSILGKWMHSGNTDINIIKLIYSFL